MNIENEQTKNIDPLAEKVAFWTFLVYLIALALGIFFLTETALTRWTDLTRNQITAFTVPIGVIAYFIAAHLSARIATWALNSVNSVLDR